MQNFNSNGGTFAYAESGQSDDNAPLVFWAHGWGQTHQGFIPLLETLRPMARHIAIDFPGFGDAPDPPEDWGTEDYADAIAAWMKAQNMPPVLWVGHSFGCRVGIQLAARHPECVAEMCLIAGAGLKRKRPAHQKFYFYSRIRLFKLLKNFIPNGTFKNKIMRAFGSADYNNASGVIRKIFVRVVNEDLSDIASDVACPVHLIYGENDIETPPEFGKRYAELMKDAKLHLLSGQDHYSVLQDGRHPVIKILHGVIKGSS